MSSKIILVLGAGPNTGLSLIKKFSQHGYKTIGVSRTPSPELLKTADLAISADLTKFESIPNIFAEVRSKVGIPNVVVYNSSGAHMSPDPFLISVDDFIQDFNINVLGAFAAMKTAITAFEELPAGEEKTFIYTGNGLTGMNIVGMMTLGLGKRAGLVLVENAVASNKIDGAKFYFADERKETGEPVYGKISGEAHGEFYFQLAEGRKQGPFQATFVQGRGYVDFEGRVGPKK